MTATNELKEKFVEHVRENSNFLKMFIFFEVENAEFQRNPYSRSIHEQCYENYKILCRKYGDDAMDYQEFEFWYMRFSRGEFDMDYDRRLAPKTRSFTDLPVHIFEMIAENFDMHDRLVVRRVSKTLQSLIDISLSKISKINVNLSEYYWIVNLDGDTIFFKPDDWRRGHRMTTGEPRTHKLCRFLSIFQNPKLKLKTLGLRYSDVESSEIFNKMLRIAQYKNNQKIHVEKLNITTDWDSVLDLNILMSLQYLDPGILQKIDFLNDIKTITDSKKVMKKLVDLEQFQRIPVIEWQGEVGVTTKTLPLFLKSSRVTFRTSGINAKSLANMIKTLMKSTVLERFDFLPPEMLSFPAPTLSKMLTQPDFFKRRGDPANIRFHKNQEDQLYRIEITQTLITIEKVEN